jgi:hypothetical protein
VSPLISSVLLGLVFLAVFIAAVTSRSARTTTVPALIGITAGLFSVQLVNVHVMSVVTFAWFVACAGRGEARLSWRVAALPLVCIPMALTVLVGDLVVNPNLALQLLALTLSAAFIISAWKAEIRRPILLGLLTAITTSSLLGLLQVAHVVPTDLWHVEVSALGRPTGFYPEPDWLGMYAGVGVLLGWRIPLEPRLRIVIVLVNLSALVLAFARAAWLGFALAAAFALVLWIATRRQGEPTLGSGKTGRLRALVFTGAALFAAVVVLPDLRRDLLVRLGSTLTAQSSDVSAQARVEQNRTLSALADSAPWYGHGLSASGRVGVSGIFYSNTPGNSVASNWVLGFWVDAAWLAVPFFIVVFVAIIGAARRIEGSLLVVVTISSFFSNASFQPVLWTLLALAIAAGTAARNEASRVEAHANEVGGEIATHSKRARRLSAPSASGANPQQR